MNNIFFEYAVLVDKFHLSIDQIKHLTHKQKQDIYFAKRNKEGELQVPKEDTTVITTVIEAPKPKTIEAIRLDRRKEYVESCNALWDAYNQQIIDEADKNKSLAKVVEKFEDVKEPLKKDPTQYTRAENLNLLELWRNKQIISAEQYEEALSRLNS